MSRPEVSLLAGTLDPAGYRRPMHISEERVPQDFTFVSGEATSNIDELFVAPDLLQICDVLILTRIEGLQHGLLTCQSATLPCHDVLAVRHPPSVEMNARAYVSPIDWTQLERHMKKVYQEEPSEPNWRDPKMLGAHTRCCSLNISRRVMCLFTALPNCPTQLRS